METTIQKSKLTPRFFFISLGVVVSLITSVVSFLVLLFESLNKKFPDALNSVYQYGYNSYNYETIRASLATLIIFFPVFLVISYIWVRECKEDIGYVNLTIRKWMIYLIMFLATLVIIIDLVTLVKYFISGEITLRFIFKALGALLVAFLVDFYYSFKMKNISFNSKQSKKWGMVCFVVSLILFFGLVVWSFFVMGSPAKQRAWRFDERRTSDLQSIQYQVINYWQQKEKLPASLSELSNPISSYSIPVDPEFSKNKVYEYIPKTNLTFELCATFTEDAPSGLVESGGLIVYDARYSEKSISAIPASGGNESWNHGKGRTCFSRTIDTDIYLPFKKEIK